MFSTRPVAVVATFSLAAAVVLMGAGAADADAGWSIPATNCAGHWYGTGANGNICVFNAANFSTGSGSGDIVDDGSIAEGIGNFASHVYGNPTSSLDNSMSSYMSGVNASMTWWANAGYSGTYLSEQPLGYRENLSQDGFDNVASAIEIN